MTAHREDLVADPGRTVAELEQRLQASRAERDEALAQGVAATEVLQVINSSPGNLAAVFDTIVEKAARLCDAFGGALWLVEGDLAKAAGGRGGNMPEPLYEYLTAEFVPVRYLLGRDAPENAFVHTADLKATKPYQNRVPFFVANVDLGGVRTTLGVPLMDGAALVGVFSLVRQEVRPFTDKQIAVVQSFAAQAVIAIQNARLFNESKEALERQTATADILKVIASSPSDVHPVFEAIASSANRLIGAFSTAVFRFVEGVCHLAAFTPTHPAADEILKASFPRPLAGLQLFELAQKGESVQIADTELASDPQVKDIARARGFRSMLFAPLMSPAGPIGLISVTRPQPGSFEPQHVHLLQTFADQAVVAIENARLFEQLQTRTRELTESLAHQTATSDVLNAISNANGGLDVVFDTMLEKAMQLCGAEFGVLNTFDGKRFRTAATRGLPPEYEAFRRRGAIDSGPGTVPVRLLEGEAAIQIVDLASSQAYLAGEPNRRALVDLGGARALAAVVLREDQQVLGNLMIFKPEPAPFSEKQIALLQHFAAQAVIAIANARLLGELRHRTDDLSESLQFQTATSEVLKVISRSPDALQPVLDVIVETSRELCGSDASTIFLLRDGKFHVTALAGSVPRHLAYMRANPQSVDQPGSVLARVTREKRTLHVPNVADDPELKQGAAGVGGPRALLVAPLVRDSDVLGVIVLRQSHLKPFTPRQIEAIEVFADQAVIALSNVNLFEQLQQRTRELSTSLDNLRTAQDRLVQTEKLASLGQLTAGIAHEIKNPLNFVNNFSALSAELVDELNDVLKPAALNDAIGREIDQLTRMLKDNLEKVVQHGKRADSIVKNMLLHSREGSGEHRPTDINALLEESLNLAYHGARAEKPDFNVTLRRDFDAGAGMVELFPQEITRAFLNLISNGFYATAKRRTEAADDFEPILQVTTKNIGSIVEIRIRDNGTGIPAEVKEKMFNPFFTTKPAGEGTGLGLSMSHDIIVKQHGGTIDVETEPGQFTEFKIVLPRTSRV
jgi:two-component system NtrC family sensor kinase